MTLKPLISVNLLLFKPGVFLEPCLESIVAQNYQNFELLIIDNASGDGTEQAVQDFFIKNSQFRQWRVIVSERNLGFAGGHNLGIKESRGELIAAVNQDVILSPDFLTNILAVFTDPQVGSAQGKLRRLKNLDGRFEKTGIIDSAGLVILKNRRIISRGQGKEDQGQFSETEEIFGVDGALPVYRRDALEDVKIFNGKENEYFDEDFFAYKEDVDLAWRLRLLGWRAFFVPSSIAWHARTSGDSAETGYLNILQERRKINALAKRLSFRNQRLMQIKNEQLGLLLCHFFYFLPKEIAAWAYVLFFEPASRPAIGGLIKKLPAAWRKRREIMRQRKATFNQMAKWFV
ncbi:MAG: glycosyltransferase family 2 protein [Patescibacteria group bacterium]